MAIVKEKLKGKEWYQIYTPKLFGDLVIGETPSLDPELLKGRTIEVSLMDLSGDTNKYYIKLFFKVSEIDGNKALTKFSGHDCTKDFTARIVQVRTSRIDTNDVIQLTDGKIRLKAIAISNRVVNTNLKIKIRKYIKEIIKNEISKMSIEQFVKNMVIGKTQQKIKREINKIYPLRFFEFRKSEVL